MNKEEEEYFKGLTEKTEKILKETKVLREKARKHHMKVNIALERANSYLFNINKDKIDFLLKNINFKNNQNYVLGRKIKYKILNSGVYDHKTSELINGFDGKKREQIIDINLVNNKIVKSQIFFILYLTILFGSTLFFIYKKSEKSFYFGLYFFGGFVLFFIFIFLLGRLTDVFEKKKYIFYWNKKNVIVIKK